MNITKFFKFNKKKEELINKKVLQNIINNSGICQHALRELNIAGFDRKEDSTGYRLYQKVMEAVALFSYHHENDDFLALEVDIVTKLVSKNVISKLRFTDDEWIKFDSEGTCYNKRKEDIIKYPNGHIRYQKAFDKLPRREYDVVTGQWKNDINDKYYSGGLFEYKDNVFTGRYFNMCILSSYNIKEGWVPKETRHVDCIDIKLDFNNSIMAVSSDSIYLILLSIDYDIVWRNCPSIKGIRIEDITNDIVEKAYNELNNN